MTPEEKGALLLAHHEGKVIEEKSQTFPYDWQDSGGDFPLSHYAYRICHEPKVETVELYGRPDIQWVMERCDYDTHRITFNLVNGKPDCTSIKMEVL